MSLIIGLTGGIASGKSTVSGMMKELGIPVVDADLVSRQVVEVGEDAYEAIVSYFGEEILLADKGINRLKLGEIIFNNTEKRFILNSIVHPAVRKEMNKQKEAYIKKGHPVVVLDIPLLFESKLTGLVEKIILVYVDYEIQVERLMARNQFTKEEAIARIKSQMPLDEKIPLADEVIRNDGTIEETKSMLLEIIHRWNLK